MRIALLIAGHIFDGEQSMALNIDTYLGLEPTALKLETRRMAVLADNLANVDTPNYKARDIDFRAALAAASTPGSSLNLATTKPGDIGSDPATSGSAELKYRVPLAPALDGNTVDGQLEQAAFADNTVRFQATLTILNSRLKDLLTAITGS